MKVIQSRQLQNLNFPCDNAVLRPSPETAKIYFFAIGDSGHIRALAPL
jgi:hypothetical protein